MTAPDSLADKTVAELRTMAEDQDLGLSQVFVFLDVKKHYELWHSVTVNVGLNSIDDLCVYGKIFPNVNRVERDIGQRCGTCR